MTSAEPQDSPTSKLDSFAASAAEDGGDSGSFMNPTAKKKAGRPKGSKNKDLDEKTEPGVFDIEKMLETNRQLTRPLISLMSDAGQRMCSFKGEPVPEAAIPPEQAKILVDTSAACIHQYLPGMIGTHANLIVFGMTFSQWAFGVYLLRQARIAQIRAENYQKNQDVAQEAELIRNQKENPLNSLNIPHAH